MSGLIRDGQLADVVSDLFGQSKFEFLAAVLIDWYKVPDLRWLVERPVGVCRGNGTPPVTASRSRCGAGRTVQTATFAGSIGLQSCNRWPRV